MRHPIYLLLLGITGLMTTISSFWAAFFHYRIEELSSNELNNIPELGEATKSSQEISHLETGRNILLCTALASMGATMLVMYCKEKIEKIPVNNNCCSEIDLEELTFPMERPQGNL